MRPFTHLSDDDDGADDDDDDDEEDDDYNDADHRRSTRPSNQAWATVTRRTAVLLFKSGLFPLRTGRTGRFVERNARQTGGHH